MWNPSSKTRSKDKFVPTKKMEFREGLGIPSIQHEITSTVSTRVLNSQASDQSEVSNPDQLEKEGSNVSDSESNKDDTVNNDDSARSEHPSEVEQEVETEHDSSKVQSKEVGRGESSALAEDDADNNDDSARSKHPSSAEITSQTPTSRAELTAAGNGTPKSPLGAIPISRTEYRKKGNLVGGSLMTCLPDAAAMVISDLGIACTYHEARKVLMPGWRDPITPPPNMFQVICFYRSKQLSVFSRSELISNPLALFRQTEGIFHLVCRVTIACGKTSKHAAVYNAVEGVLKDNTWVNPIRVEDTDRTSKRAARAVFKMFWPSVTTFDLTHVYHVTLK